MGNYMSEKKELLSLTMEELCITLNELREPKFRAKQIFDWLHAKRIPNLSDAKNLPSALIERLNNEFIYDYPSVALCQTDEQGTKKYLLRLSDGNAVEAVLLHHRHGDSLCISTQVGCKMGCVFCASAKAGFVRDMTVGELLSQVYLIASLCDKPPRHLVLMGIGEPLDNYDNVVKFLRLLSDESGYNIAGRNITLSTSGLVPQIERLSDEKLSLTLSISLHRTTDDERVKVMPIARRYPLNELLDALYRYGEVTGRRVSIEYAVVSGENDTEQDAERLCEMFRSKGVHINLIPLNSIDGENTNHDAAAREFEKRLTLLGLQCTIRRRLGAEIEAACGQLRRKNL